MTKKGSTKKKPPSEATLKQFAGALTGIAAAMTSNAADQQDAGERRASNEQRRTTLDYLVLGAVVGRTVPRKVVVRAERFRRKGNDRVRIYGVPKAAAKVALHASGAIAPEVIVLPTGGDQKRRRTVTLVETKGKEIVRLELRDVHGRPIRLGPRLAPPPKKKRPGNVD